MMRERSLGFFSLRLRQLSNNNMMKKEEDEKKNDYCVESQYFHLSQFAFSSTIRCTNDEFQCLDDSCISLAFKCDGEQDCSSGEDELNCPEGIANCPEGEFKCKGLLGGMGGPGGRCILQRFRCDGDNGELFLLQRNNYHF